MPEPTEEELLENNRLALRLFSGHIMNVREDPGAFYEFFSLERPRNGDADVALEDALDGQFNDEDLKQSTLKGYRPSFTKFVVSCRLVHPHPCCYEMALRAPPLLPPHRYRAIRPSALPFSWLAAMTPSCCGCRSETRSLG